MKQQTYRTNADYIESMMKQFKLVDMREQYRDLILEAESSSMDYESFLAGQKNCRRKRASSRKSDWKTLTTALTSHWIRTRSRNLAGSISLILARTSL